MDKNSGLIMASGKLTVFFEEPFWVGVFEITTGAVENRTQSCEPQTAGSRKRASV